MKRILLSFTGARDPFPIDPDTGKARKDTGPLLTVADERQYDRIYLFETPKMGENTAESVKELARRCPDAKVVTLDVMLNDPTNYLGILSQLRTHLETIKKKDPDAQYFIAVSSGTPQMHASWLMLAASGEVPNAMVLQAGAPEHTREGRSRVSEVDFTRPEFPEIRPFRRLQEEFGEYDLEGICDRLAIVGKHPVFEKALRESYALAAYDEPILLLGETGTGKEVFAGLIHESSERAERPLITVNCAAIPPALIESQLFGHKKGAFTGAISDHKGFFEDADGATIFLDELGELPTTSQAKILRFLQEGMIQRVGETNERQVNVRVIAATNVDILSAIEQGRFRQDLYHRFIHPIHIPNLSDRRSDIPLIARHILDRWTEKTGKPRRFTPGALRKLAEFNWPGNVRQLANTVTSSAILSDKQTIGPRELDMDTFFSPSEPDYLPEPHEGFDMTEYISRMRNRLIDRALELANGNKSAAARMLGVSASAIGQHLNKDS